jgi:hypothetical protein
MRQTNKNGKFRGDHVTIERATALPLPRDLQSRLAAALAMRQQNYRRMRTVLELYHHTPGAGYHVNA